VRDIGDTENRGAVVADQHARKLVKIGAKVISHGRYVMFQMVEVAVSRQMFADILMRIARLRAPPVSARGALGSMGQATTAKVRLDAGKAARFTASLQLTGWFDCLLRTRSRDLPLSKTPEGAIMAPQHHRNRGNVG
jgi:hypothetical protein